MIFRTLNADEIECRPGTISEKGLSILLYKDARVDMTLLDETVGPENWQRSHELINGNLFCNVSIYVNEEWVTKQDVGTVSNTEAEKGQASDSFKRACVNWGIGRELYTAPFIWINADLAGISNGKNGKPTTKERFKVKTIAYDDKRNISALEIVNEKTGVVVYRMGGYAAVAPKPLQEDKPQAEAVELAEAKSKVMAHINNVKMSKDNVKKLCDYYGVSSVNEMTLENCNNYLMLLKAKGMTA